MKISIVVLTKDEEDNIADCIKSVDFADEIIVIDDKSTDDTRKIAKDAGSRVLIRSLDSNYAEQKNFALKKAKGRWILFLDADERLSEELKKEILDVIKGDYYSVYKFRRIDKILGKWLKYGDIGVYRDIRLMKKNTGKWERRVHEYFVTKNKVGEIRNPILHNSHPTLEHLITNTNRWSSWHSKANKEEGKRASLFKILFWPKGKFFDSYILKLGFLDGIHGFVFAIFVSLHSFLAWSKLWLLQRKN